MNRVLKGVLISSAITGAAYYLWSRLNAGERVRIKLVPPVQEVELESLPEDLRKELLAELEDQLQ